jgi:transglutaminase-like putative cysteine protease
LRNASADARQPTPLPVRALVATLVAVGAIGAVAFMVVPAARSSRLLAFTAKLPHALSVPTPGGLSNPSLGRDDPGRSGNDPTDSAPKSFGYFGFADHLDTSVRGRPDNTLVMRVRASAPDFWRGQTFDTWDGRSWTLSDARTALVSSGSPLQLLQPAGEPPVTGDELIQTFSLEVSGPNLIFAANQPTQVYIPQSAVFETTDGAIRTGVELEQGAVYTVVSRRPQTTAARLRAAGDAAQITPPELAQRYTRLPQIPERVRSLATELTQGQATTYDKVLAIEGWMAKHTQYSLDIPPLPPGEDAVERFLFVDKVGFCEQIASSLVVMLRSQGISARLAAGYTPGERNPFTGFYEVRARDAHAWAEVYFPTIGWQAFDPTAQVPLAGDAPPDAARVGLRAYLSRHLPDLRSPLGAILALTSLIGALVLWRQPLGAMLLRLRRRRHRSWAELQLARLEAIGADLGRQREPGETVVEYAAALQRTVLRDPAVGEVAAAITADGFAATQLSDDERDEVTARLTALAK